MRSSGMVVGFGPTEAAAVAVSSIGDNGSADAHHESVAE